MFSSNHATRHIQKVCRQRKALYVNEGHGPTYSMRGEPPVAKTSGMYSKASTVHTRGLRRFVTVSKQTDSKQPNQTQPNAQQPDAQQLEPAKEGSTQPSSTKEKLIPLSGFIRARDSQGWQYDLSFRHIEMEVDWPVTGGHCKVTGTAMVSSW